MTVYYFHLRDGQGRLLDPLGRTIDDSKELGAIALREVRALIAEDVLKGNLDLNQRLEIEDDAGTIVHRLRFADAVDVKDSPLDRPM